MGQGVAYLFFAAVAAAYAGLEAWSTDDAHISFRYARQLLDGHGLVFNVGERVEGYTNFLWILEVALLSAVSPLALPQAATVLSALLTVGTFAIVLSWARTGPVVALRPFVALTAFGLLAINRHVAVWATSGLETRQFTFLVVLGAYLAHRARGRPRLLLWAALALAAAELTRPEGPLFWGGVLLWYLLDGHRHRRLGGRGLLALTAPFIAVVIGHYLFRRLYYGDWLPNTYYAKHLRAWPDAGIHYFTALFCESALYLALPLAVLGAFYRFMHRRDGLPLLMICLVIPHAIYLVQIGGDHFEFRVFDFYWPLWALVCAEGLALIVLLLRLWARRRWRRAALLGFTVGGAGAVVLAVYTVTLQIAPQLLTYEQTGFSSHVNEPVTEENFPFAYLLPFGKHVTPLYNKASARVIAHAIAVRHKEHTLFAAQQTRAFGAYGHPTRRRLPADAVQAYPFAGIMPYHLPDLTVIDTLGLVDRTVARNGGAQPNAERRMAHDRWPPAGYLDARGVNIDVRAAARSLGEALAAATFAAPLAPGLWLPFETPAPAWAERAFRGYPLYRRPAWSGDVSQIEAVFADRKLRGHKRLAGFDGSDDGWRLDGVIAPLTTEVRGQGKVEGQIGAGRLSSFGPDGDRTRGRAESPAFTAQAGDVLAFLLAGGSHAVGVTLTADSTAVAQWRGVDSERFRPVMYDLTPHAGKRLVLQAFDDSAASWGHIMLDEVVLLRP